MRCWRCGKKLKRGNIQILHLICGLAVPVCADDRECWDKGLYRKGNENEMNLYQIRREIEDAIEMCIDMETGEITHPEILEELNMKRDIKRENVALYIKNQLPEIEAINAEIKTLTARKKAKQNRVEWLKKYLADDMTAGGIKKFETPKVAVSFRRSEILEVENPCAVPKEFLIEQAPKVNKTELKKRVKEGAIFNGVKLVERQNLQIK